MRSTSLHWVVSVARLVARAVAPAVALSVVAGCSSPLQDAAMGDGLRLQPPPSTTQQARVCAAGATVPGIDVSKWQGDINWTQVANDGVEYAFIRVSDGLNFVDEYFDDNWAEAKANGIRRGAYQFMRQDLDPIAQADLLLQRMGTLEPGDLPPVVDVESTDGADADTIVANVQLWVEHVEAATGMRPIVYTGRYFWRDNVDDRRALNHLPMWIPNWGADCPTLPDAWADWAFWQHSATGTVAGISGDVDLNHFNGTTTQLARYGLGGGVCGDGLCTGGETAASCAADCDTCESIPPAGRVVDDDELCFTDDGNPDYIRHVDTDGYGGGLKWSRSWVTTTADNMGTWRLKFDSAGEYLVEVYVDGDWGEWTRALYEVTHDGVVDVVRVDQSDIDGWLALGTFDFAAGAQQVRVVDIAEGQADTGLQFVMDALRVTPTTPPDDDAGAPVVEDAGPPPADAGGPMPDAGVAPPSDAGVVDEDGGTSAQPEPSPEGEPDGAPEPQPEPQPDASPDDEPGVALSPAPEPPEDLDPSVQEGCNCDAGGRPTSSTGLFAVLLLGLWHRRCRRRPC